MRKVNLIILHCSATNNLKHDDISVIKKWHVEDNGWSDVGYHYFIKMDGTLQKGRPERKIGAHCKGKNAQSIGICLHGLKATDFTDIQLNTAALLIMDIYSRYPEEVIDLAPHRLFSNKSCPVFNMIEIFKRIY